MGLFSLDLTTLSWTKIVTDIQLTFLEGEEVSGINMFTNSKDALYFTGGMIDITEEFEGGTHTEYEW